MQKFSFVNERLETQVLFLNNIIAFPQMYSKSNFPTADSVLKSSKKKKFD